MHSNVIPDFRPAALAFANAIRKELGYKPATRLAKGYPRDYTACPISNTIRGRNEITVKTGIDDVIVTNNRGQRQIFPVPIDALDFITCFDDGDYPDLIRR